MIRFFRDRPWIWIVFAFVVLITGWVFLLRLAGEKRPESVEIKTITQQEQHDEP
ncbi:MAG: hypothetical protein P1U58_08870 [Verrucomicrobiales bacterium]|nr:hypothetical protein [Verrucomicrobiales bacterium]